MIWSSKLIGCVHAEPSFANLIWSQMMCYLHIICTHTTEVSKLLSSVSSSASSAELAHIDDFFEQTDSSEVSALQGIGCLCGVSQVATASVLW